LHLAGLVSIWSSGVDAAGADLGMLVVRSLALGLSACFFVLKLADVTWLRLRPGWRPFIVSLSVMALLHVNVARRAVDGELDYSPASMAALLFVGTLVESDGVRRNLVRWAKQVAAASDLRIADNPLSPEFCARALLDRARQRHSLLIRSLLAARPPPTA